MVFAAVMAGGNGSRMGVTDVPKQFLTLGDCPIIIHTLRRFAECKSVVKTAVMCPDAWVGYTQSLVEKYLGEYADKIVVSGGGKTRNETLEKSVELIIKKFGAKGDDIILTHDAVRPFVTEKMIEENIEAASRCGSCNTVTGAVDTITISADGKFIDYAPERETVFHSQTPQSFRLSEYLDSLGKLGRDEREKLTDVCSLFTKTGKKVFMVEGSADNIKITRPADLETAKAILENMN
ncbi:MAG: 2-C-methyl-D-erythritol 4-phosphate cytidylyltransferase [Clostridia bacterium]|nr:2-C-methyl-D-erythritol 4-phosphate cytidylyltransferase [Clostridia bacterium]